MALSGNVKLVPLKKQPVREEHVISPRQGLPPGASCAVSRHPGWLCWLSHSQEHCRNTIRGIAPVLRPPGSSICWISLNPCNYPVRWVFFPHLLKEETKGLREVNICPRSHTQPWQRGTESRFVWLQSHALSIVPCNVAGIALELWDESSRLDSEPRSDVRRCDTQQEEAIPCRPTGDLPSSLAKHRNKQDDWVGGVPAPPHPSSVKWGFEWRKALLFGFPVLKSYTSWSIAPWSIQVVTHSKRTHNEWDPRQKLRGGRGS